MNPIAIALIAELAVNRADRPDAGIPAWIPTTPTVTVSKPAEYHMRRSGDGYVYDAPQFEARIAADGMVTFKDVSVRDPKVGIFTLLSKPQTKEGGRSNRTALPLVDSLLQPAPAAVRQQAGSMRPCTVPIGCR